MVEQNIEVDRFVKRWKCPYVLYTVDQIRYL